MRITAELIQVRGQTQLWAESFERELASILALQSEVAKKVAGSLALRLLPAEQARLANVRQVNPEAYEAYLKGQFHWHRLSPQDLDAALQYFELALEKDPNYALGYAGIAEVWAGRQQMGVASPDEATPKATAAAEKALELDNTSAEVHYASAIVKAWSEWDWEGAETAFRRAIALNPSYPDAHAYYSHLLYIMRRPKEALEHMEQALAVDPFNHLFQSLHGCGLVLVGRYDDAIVQLRSALRTAPGSSIAPAGLWYAFHEKGMYGEALASAITLYAGIGYGEAAEALRRGEAKANYREAMRDAGEAKANYREAMRDAGEALAARSSTAYVSANEIATLFACAGMNDQALDWLEKGVEVHEPNMPYIGLMPYFQGLHDAPRFQELVRRMKLRL